MEQTTPSAALILAEIKQQAATFEKALKEAKDLKRTEELFQSYLGKKGSFNAAFQEVVKLPTQAKAEAGAFLNQEKKRLTELLQKAQHELNAGQLTEEMAKEWLDVSLEPPDSSLGGTHPISHVQYKLIDIFLDLGFSILDGPEVETDYYNFEALNFPPDHPARDAQDTFYLKQGRLLRTQTSNIQIRALEQKKPPFKVAGPGKVFRAERIDASHSSVFHQFEGMMVGENIGIAHMLFFLNKAIEGIFERPVKTRIRPGYFPFVEPGLECDIHCLICDGKGCSACKQVGWLELLGCGLTHPKVLSLAGIDPDRYSGFAFGMGIDRIAMLKFGIKDIRLFGTGNLAFAKQFVGVAL